MKKNGFTLIELLAIIIILAIVALVATPIVINVIDDAKDRVAFTEAAAFVNGIETNCSAREMLAGGNIEGYTACGTTLTNDQVKDIAVNVGNASLVGTAELTGSKVTSLTVSSNGRTIYYNGTTYVKTSNNQ